MTEEVSKYIVPCGATFEALKRLKELYDSHSELKIIQLLLKLFNLEMKDNDPLKSSCEVKFIFHDIKATRIKVDLQLLAFIKFFQPVYSNYLESLQAGGKLKDITFDKLVRKIAEREKSFGKKESASKSSVETFCLAQKD